MNLSYYIANKIARNKSKSISRFIIRLATAATVFSVAAMIVSVSVVQGFKSTIRDKMFVFWGHFHISPFNPNATLLAGSTPFKDSLALKNAILYEPEVENIYPFALGTAIIATETDNEGVKVKGITKEYFSQTNKAIQFSGGKLDFGTVDYARQIILSEQSLNRINKQIGDTVLTYFIIPNEERPRVRKLAIVGTFKVGIEEIDKNFAMCDIRLLRQLNGWDNSAITGYQVSVKDYRQADTIANRVYKQYLDLPLTAIPMSEIYKEIFQWLNLQDINARLILIILSLVAVINMITALLIFIMERNNMTGILRTMGMDNRSILKIFLQYILKIILKGIVLGAILGIAICLLQYYTHIISIEETAYYMQYVPIKIGVWEVLAVMIGTFMVSMLILTIPAWLMIKRKNIIDAIRFK